MGFRIEQDAGLVDELRRVVDLCIGHAIGVIDAIEADGPSRHDAVHEVRKDCKRIRSALRLFRGALPAYSAENACFRDTARTLAPARDAGTLVECLDALAGRFDVDAADDAADDAAHGAAHGAAGDAAGDEAAGPDEVRRVRAALVERRDALCAALDVPALLGQVRESLCAARGRLGGWTLEADGFDAMADGLQRVHARARRGRARVREEPTTDALHEWRKRVKSHRDHLLLLRGLWPPVSRARRKGAGLLADRLGDDHDLAVLRVTLADEAGRFDTRARAAVERLADRRRAELQAWATPLGARLFAEKPRRFRDRVRQAWDARVLERRLAGVLPDGSGRVS